MKVLAPNKPEVNAIVQCICLILFLLVSMSNDLSAQSTSVIDPCMALTTTTQTANGTETHLKKLKLSALDSSLYKYWNGSTESNSSKIRKVEKDLNDRKDKDVISYVVDECDPGGGGGCSISAPNASDASRCGPGVVTLSATPGSGGNVVYWYETSSSISPFSIQNNVTVNVSDDRYYYVSSYNTSTGCESYKAAVYVAINGWGIDGNISTSVTAVYLGQSITISSTGGTGTPHYWSSTNGGTSWNIFSDSFIGQSSFTYTPTTTGTFRFMLRNKTVCGFCYDNGSCPNYPYVDIVVINSSPPSPSTQSAFVYGYNSSLLIAEVTNANNNQIAYTSFESGDKGNWTYSGTPAGNASDFGRTGNKYYNLSSGSVQRIGLQNGKYTLTYWSDVEATVGGTNYTLVNKTTEATISSWTLYRVVFNLSNDQSSITISGSSKIDEIRLHPYDAYMVTSTYDPLIGKTSETDLNNRTLYYVYDEFNRLKFIKDQNGNIRKSFTYNYKN